MQAGGELQQGTVELSRLDRHLRSLRLPKPEAVRAVQRSIERHGLLHALVVNGAGERLELLDGFKRVEALEALGMTQAPVRRVTLEAQQAKAALLSFNAPHRGVCELEEAWVVRALVREHGLQQTQVAELLGRHKSWVCRRLQLCERLETSVAEDMRLGLLSATVARELARLPHGNQPQVAESVRQHQLSSRQAGELVARFLGTALPDARQALLKDPLRLLGQQAAGRHPDRDPRLSPEGQDVRQRLLRFGRTALGLDRTIRWYLGAGLGEGDLDILVDLARPAQATSESVGEALELLVAKRPCADAA